MTTIGNPPPSTSHLPPIDPAPVSPYTAGVTTPPPPPPGDSSTEPPAGMSDLPPPQPGALSGTGSTPMDGLEEEFSADVYAFLALFQQLAQTMKTFAKLEAITELQAQVNALVSAAEDMKAAAEKRFTSALTQAMGQIVSGAVQVGAGSLALLATYQSVAKENASLKAKAEKEQLAGGAKDADEGGVAKIKAEDPKGDKNPQTLDQQSRRYAAAGQFGNIAGTGLGQSTTGSTSLAAARDSRDAELLEAERTEKDAIAAEHEKVYQASMEFASTMQEIISATRQALNSMEQQRNENVRATLRA